MTGFPPQELWHRACRTDATLAAWAGPWTASFAIACGSDVTSFRFGDGVLLGGADDPAFTLAAPADVWDRFLQPIPPRHHHGIFAMHYRVPAFSIQGDQLAFMQFAHVVRRVLEIGKWLALGNAEPVPVTLAPRSGTPTSETLTSEAPGQAAASVPEVTGGYVPVTARGTSYHIYHETAGSGRDLLCLHTAGSDSRQFHGLMADPRLTGSHRLVAFDLPWHGKSPPPAGGIPGSWRLDTALYVELIMGFIHAAGLDRPVVLGASMSGEICLELAYRHPDAFQAIIACEACDKIERRQTAWAAHPQVNQAFFVPEWIRALSAPQSPAECQEAIAWHYAQGGPAVFFGDIAFYSGEWDARDRVSGIDTSRCPLFMLTGEYDYSCTTEMSAATAAKIPGAVFQEMKGIGHFPFAENPRGFAEYLLPVLLGLDRG